MKFVNNSHDKYFRSAMSNKNVAIEFFNNLYLAKINGDKGFLYLLVEHQSKADRLMPFRVLEYACRIMRQDLNNGKKSLPIVIPLVFITGKLTIRMIQIFFLFSQMRSKKTWQKNACVDHLI